LKTLPPFPVSISLLFIHHFLNQISFARETLTQVLMCLI
jgi:hypothetical protein